MFHRLLYFIFIVSSLFDYITCTSESFFALDDNRLPPSDEYHARRHRACKRPSQSDLPESPLSTIPKELVSSIFEKADLKDYKLLMLLGKDLNSLLGANKATFLAILENSSQKEREHYFWTAVARGSAKIVEIFLESPHINASMYNNFAIVVAAQDGHYDVAKLLMKQQDVDVTVDHNLPIRLAAGYGQARVVKLLLKDPRVNPADQHHDAIREAVRCGKVDVVRTFLVFPTFNPPKNLLYLAAKYNQHKIVKLLLQDKRFHPRWYQHAAIRAAAKGGHTKTAEILLQDKRTNPAAMNNDAIFRASTNGHFEVVRLLLKDSRVKASARNNAALYNAAYHGHNAIVRLLLKQKDVTLEGGYKKIFQVALFNDELDIAQETLQAMVSQEKVAYITALEIFKSNYMLFKEFSQKIPMDSEWWTYFLSLAAKHSTVSVVEEIIRVSKINPAAHHNLALRTAAEHGKINIVNFLLSDPRVHPAAMNNAAVKLATMNGWDTIVSELIEDSRVDIYDTANEDENADFETVFQGRNDQGHYPSILIATQHGHYDIVEMLLVKSVFEDRTVGFTDSMFAACSSGRLDIVKLIRAHQSPSWDEIVVAAYNGHADIVHFLVKDYENVQHLENALYEAAKAGHQQIVEILLSEVAYSDEAIATARSFALKFSQYPVISLLENTK